MALESSDVILYIAKVLYQSVFRYKRGGINQNAKIKIDARFLERKLCNPLVYVADMLKKIKGLRTALSYQC